MSGWKRLSFACRLERLQETCQLWSDAISAAFYFLGEDAGLPLEIVSRLAALRAAAESRGESSSSLPPLQTLGLARVGRRTRRVVYVC